MMVLSRRVGERIIIGEGEDEIIIEVTEIDRGVVGIGIDAPREVLIDREEIRIRKERNEDMGYSKPKTSGKTVWDGGARKGMKDG